MQNTNGENALREFFYNAQDIESTLYRNKYISSHLHDEILFEFRALKNQIIMQISKSFVHHPFIETCELANAEYCLEWFQSL
jgi:hypothetical protein